MAKILKPTMRKGRAWCICDVHDVKGEHEMGMTEWRSFGALCRSYSQGWCEGKIHQGSPLLLATSFTVSFKARGRCGQASQDIKQMLWSLPLKLASRSLMAQRY